MPGARGPVWSGSTTKEIKFQPMSKKAATKLWHRARDFDRQTRRKNWHGGTVGHTGLQVLHTLIFDFLNFGAGRLDPSYAAIARKASVCERIVATGAGLQRAPRGEAVNRDLTGLPEIRQRYGFVLGDYHQIIAELLAGRMVPWPADSDPARAYAGWERALDLSCGWASRLRKTPPPHCRRTWRWSKPLDACRPLPVDKIMAIRRDRCRIGRADDAGDPI